MKTEAPSFFEKYAHEYDYITNASARIKPHEQEIQAMINRFQPKSVLDAGCATGLTSMLFACRGVTAVGLDRSESMLQVAREKYGDNNLPLEFVQGNFEKLPIELRGRFDLVVCLANSISGVGTTANLLRSFRNFHAALKPNGSLVLQMLNYASVKEGEIMPIRATTHDRIIYLRFAERVKKGQQVHVIRVDSSTNPPSFEVFRHSFDNFTAAEVTKALREAGFGKLQRFSKLDFAEPYTSKSRDLVITASRQ